MCQKAAAVSTFSVEVRQVTRASSARPNSTWAKWKAVSP